MSTQYPVLGSPLQVNGITLKNRMITTSMSPGAGYVTKDNRPTQRLANYLEERAEGQTALIIQTICPWKRNDIDPDHIHELPSCYDESCIPDLQRYMIEPVHKHGGLICAQPYYVHDWKPDAETPEGPYGPSDIAILKFMGGFRAMTLEQIEAFKQQYFNAARVCKEAGFDAIEVMAGVGGILSRFMALATNNRTDEYGGSLENRVKLTLEVIRGVREVVGPKFPIVVRWSPIDFIKSPAGPGLSMEDALRIAPHAGGSGLRPARPFRGLARDQRAAHHEGHRGRPLDVRLAADQDRGEETGGAGVSQHRSARDGAEPPRRQAGRGRRAALQHR